MISNTLWFCDFCHTLCNNIYVDVLLLIVHNLLKPKTVWYRELTQQIRLDKWSFSALHAKDHVFRYFKGSAFNKSVFLLDGGMESENERIQPLAIALSASLNPES